MAHLLAAPDKFRSSATATEIALACATAARARDWSVTERPLSDGGDGFLEAMRPAVEGSMETTRVTGPLGEIVAAEWLLGDDETGKRLAVIEIAKICGLELAGGREGNDPVNATTAGCGELLLEAKRRGADRIIIGCGGSATTDGGAGMLEAIGSRDALRGTEILAATDVTTRFLEAPQVFGPQKGADAKTIELLSTRLAELARRFRDECGIDVNAIDGSGAAGGLGGGLIVLGAAIVSGFDLVAQVARLGAEIARADLVVTGEGQLDATSFAGKVVGDVVKRATGQAPVLIIAGRFDQTRVSLPSGVDVVSLVDKVGTERAMHDTVRAIEEVLGEALDGRTPPST